MSNSDERDMLESALREHVRGMSEDDFQTFVAETRPPSSRQQLREVASKVLDGSQLDAWMSGVDTAKFVNDDGELVEEKVMGNLTALFGVQQDQGSGQQRPNFGQGSGQPPPALPGDAGRREAEKRFGAPNPDDDSTRVRIGSRAEIVVPHSQPTGPGARGAQEAQRRFGTEER